MKRLGIVRRLVGCFYCGRPCRGDVCRYCSDLPLRDPLVAKARQPLTEQEIIAAHGTGRWQRGFNAQVRAGLSEAERIEAQG